MENGKMKMDNEKAKFKKDFKERIYSLVLRTLKFLSALPKNEVARTATNQLTRSITSVLANYVEAQSASSKKEFAIFFQYSLKSANESAMWLELLRDTNNGKVEEIQSILKELNAITKILAVSVLTLKNKR